MQDNFYLPMFTFSLSLNRIQGRMIIPVLRRLGGKTVNQHYSKSCNHFLKAITLSQP